MSTARILADNVTMTPVGELDLHPDNANIGDLPTIVESIRVNGFYAPVIAQTSTGYVLAGNHRLQAARELGMSEVPTVWVDVDDEEATRIMLVDNRSTRLGRDDTEALAAALSQLVETDAGLLGTGFSHKDMQELLIFNDTPLPLPPEPHAPAGPQRSAKYGVEPITDGDECTGVEVTRLDGLTFSPEDYNAVREILGLGRARESEWRALGVADWV